MKHYYHHYKSLVALLLLTLFLSSSLLPRESAAQSFPECAEACITVGPRLSSVNSERGALLNAVLGGLLGTSLSVDVLDWNALAQSDLELADFLNALTNELSVSDTETALSTSATLVEVIDAAVAVAQADGSTALVDALNALRADVSGLSGTIQLGDFLQLDFPEGSLTDATINVLELVTGAIQLYNYNNVATTTGPVTVTGSALGLDSIINEVQIYAQVVEPPVYACGPAGTTVHTAAIRLKMDYDLVSLSPDLSALVSALGASLGLSVSADAEITDLEMYVEVARADAIISVVDALAQSIVVDATPGVTDLYLGTIDDAVFFNRSAAIDPETDLDFGTIGSLNIQVPLVLNETVGIQARAYAQGEAPVNQELTFNGPFPETQTAFTSATFVTNLLSTLVGDLELQLDGSLGALLDPLVNGTILPLLTTAVVDVLSPILNPLLSGVVDPTLELLGVRMGEAEVTAESFFLTSECEQLLPVELTSFKATLDGRNLVLQWDTASETNNAGFEVQMRADVAQDWSVLDFVEGHGTTEAAQSYSYQQGNMQSGTYTFRLKQIDYDGAFEYSPQIEVAVDQPEVFKLSPAYPNPFNPETSFSLSIARTQQVRLAVYDVTGRQVMVLYEGTIQGQSAQAFRLDGSQLPSGTYLLQVTGTHFSTNQLLTLIK